VQEDRSADEVDQGRRVPPTGPPAKRAKMVSVDSKFRQHLPCTGRFPKPAKTWHEGQQPHIYQTWHEGQQPHIYQAYRSKHKLPKESETTYECIILFGEVRGCVGVGEANPNRRLQEEQVGLWQEQ
jgi:hypothetical protein